MTPLVAADVIIFIFIIYAMIRKNYTFILIIIEIPFKSNFLLEITLRFEN